MFALRFDPAWLHHIAALRDANKTISRKACTQQDHPV